MTDSSSTARAYARARYRLLLIDLVVGWLFLAAFQWLGYSRGLAGTLARMTMSQFLIILGYLAVIGCVYYAVTFPLRFYGSYVLEHRFGLARFSLAQWWVREAKQLGLSALLSLLLLEGFYALLRHTPSWPVWATVGWVGFSLVMARVFPTLILPLFYNTAPLHDEALAKRLQALCQRIGLPVLGVFKVGLGAETRKANAALVGLGGTRRILLSDTLLAEFSPEEIEGVLAHEVAHHRYHHIAKLLVIATFGSWIVFTLTQAAGGRWAGPLGLDGLSDIAGFPLLMLWFSIVGFTGLPLQNALARHFEWQADHFAVVTTSPGSFGLALRRLAQLNLADPSPPRWVVWLFYDHPPITQRIDAAERAVNA